MGITSRFERVTTASGEPVTGATVHLEAMSNSDHCLIIEAGGDRLCIKIGARKRRGSRPFVDSVISWREQTARVG